MRKWFYALAVLCLLLGCLLEQQGAAAQSEGRSAVSGVVIRGISDLREAASSHEEDNVSLNGEWEFYWGRLLAPDDIQSGSDAPDYVQVPSSWRDQVVDERPLNKYGYGTYRVLIQIPQMDIGKEKALLLDRIGMAYEVWIDGISYRGLGTVGTDKLSETPESHLNLIFFHPKQETVELVIQVSNHSFREGGILTDILYGDAASIVQAASKQQLFHAFILGILLITSAYYLVLYGIRKTIKSNLYLGLFTLAASGREVFTSNYLASLFLPGHHWAAATKIEYLTEVAGFIFLILLIHEMYPKEANKKLVHLFAALALLYCFYIIFAPAAMITETLLLHAALFVIALFYFVIYVGIQAVLRRREGARMNMIGIVIIIAAVCNDTLYYLQILDTVETINYSLVLFAVIQAIIISYRYSLLSQKNEELTQEMVRINHTLEEKVTERTLELNRKNAELMELQKTKSRLLSRVAHDLGSPIVGIRMSLQLLKDGRIQAADPLFTNHMLEKTDYISRLNRDLFELSKLESKQLAFRKTKISMKELIEEVCLKFGEDFKRNGCKLQLGRCETTFQLQEVYVHVDKLRMMQVFQNLLDNALKFSRQISDTVTIHGYVDENKKSRDGMDRPRICIEVEDKGSGMASGELPHIFASFYKSEENNEKGSGLGLAISKEIIEQHGGQIGVSSELGKGSTFYFSLPLLLEEDESEL